MLVETDFDDEKERDKNNSDENGRGENDRHVSGSARSDWPTLDPTDDNHEHRIYISLAGCSKGSHLFDIADNMHLKYFLDGLFEFFDGMLWQHAAIATDIDILAVIPKTLAPSGFAERLRHSLARYLNSTSLSENDLLPFRFAVREATDLDSDTFLHECKRIMRLRTDYVRICALPVRVPQPKGLPISERSRRKRRF